MKAFFFAVAFVAAAATGASALECAQVQPQVTKVYGKRFDRHAAGVRQAAAHAAMLEKSGKKAEAKAACEKLAKDGALMMDGKK